MCVGDVAGNGSCIFCLPRHKMLFNSIREGSKSVSKMWRRHLPDPYVASRASRSNFRMASSEWPHSTGLATI